MVDKANPWALGQEAKMAVEMAGRLDLEDRRYGAPVEGGSPSPSVTLPRGQVEEEGPHFIRPGKQRVVPSCRGCHTRGRGDACRRRDSVRSEKPQMGGSISSLHGGVL